MLAGILLSFTSFLPDSPSFRESYLPGSHEASNRNKIIMYIMTICHVLYVCDIQNYFPKPPNIPIYIDPVARIKCLFHQGTPLRGHHQGTPIRGHPSGDTHQGRHIRGHPSGDTISSEGTFYQNVKKMQKSVKKGIMLCVV